MYSLNPYKTSYEQIKTVIWNFAVYWLNKPYGSLYVSLSFVLLWPKQSKTKTAEIILGPVVLHCVWTINKNQPSIYKKNVSKSGYLRRPHNKITNSVKTVWTQKAFSMRSTTFHHHNFQFKILWRISFTHTSTLKCRIKCSNTGLYDN